MFKENALALLKLKKLNSNVLLQQANHLFASGSYRLTQEIYKILLKREENPKYRAGLAQCYLQRAKLQAEKQKYQQAVSLWENYHVQQQGYESNDLYVYCLFKTHQPDVITRFVATLPDNQALFPHYPRLAQLLAYLHVIGYLNILQILQHDTLLSEQTQQINAILENLRNQHKSALFINLTTIPFHSAYSDFCKVIKAADVLYNNPDKANSLLNMVPDDSYYFQLAALLKLLTLDDRGLRLRYISLTTEKQRRISRIKNWSDRQIALLQQLSLHASNRTAERQLQLLITYSDLWPQQTAQRYAQALLIEYPQGIPEYESKFGQLQPFTRQRILALAAEAVQIPETALQHWQQCLQILLQDANNNRLTIVCLYQHMADLAENEQKESLMQQALQFDVDNKATHVLLFKTHQENGKPELAQAHLQKMLALFPADIEILQLAMHSALSKAAYVEVQGYAEKILQLDPINSMAGRVRAQSYTLHAEALMQKGQFQQAEQQLQLVERSKSSTPDMMTARVLLICICFLKDEQQSALSLLQQCLIDSRSAWLTAYAFIFEAFKFDIALTQFANFKDWPWGDKQPVGKLEFQGFLKKLLHTERQNAEAARKALLFMQADLQKQLQTLQADEQLLLAVMQAMQQLKSISLMRFCWSLQTFKEKPIWQFYQLYLAVSGNPALITSVEVSRLQHYLQTAKEQNDSRAICAISDFLQTIGEYQNNPLQYADDLSLLNPYRDLWGLMPEQTFQQLLEETENYKLMHTEQQMIAALSPYLPDQMDSNRLLRDNNLQEALLLLYCADNEQLALPFGIQDVLEIAQIDEQYNKHEVS